MKSSSVSEMAPIILAEINKSQSILLCCHPYPDPDSVGSVLAMKFILEGLSKKVTAISGDSKIPEAFMHFPAAKDIVSKNFFDIDLKSFDLFITLDSSSPDQISRLKPIVFPLSIKSIVIDHHSSNRGYGDINFIIPTSPSTGQMVFDLMQEWHIEMTPDIAANLFVSIYTDTNGLKTDGVTARTYEIMAKLVKVYPDIQALLSHVENSETPEALTFNALAFESINTFLDNKVAISAVAYDKLISKNISEDDVSTSAVSSSMKMVAGWKVLVSLVEFPAGKIKCSFRSNDIVNYPVDKLVIGLGGGGHKAAAGVTLQMSLEEAKKLIVSKAKELYNL